MRTLCNILISAAFALTMSLLFVSLLLWNVNIMAILILTHILTIVGSLLLLKKNYFCNIAFFSGLVLAIIACLIYEGKTGSDSDFLKYFFTIFVTMFYAVPALFFVEIVLVLTEKHRKY